MVIVRSVCHSCWLMGCLIFQIMKFKQEPRQLGWKRFFKGKLWQTARPYHAALKSNGTSTKTNMDPRSHYVISLCLSISHQISKNYFSLNISDTPWHGDTVTRWQSHFGISPPVSGSLRSGHSGQGASGDDCRLQTRRSPSWVRCSEGTVLGTILGTSCTDDHWCLLYFLIILLYKLYILLYIYIVGSWFVMLWKSWRLTRKHVDQNSNAPDCEGGERDREGGEETA